MREALDPGRPAAGRDATAVSAPEIPPARP